MKQLKKRTKELERAIILFNSGRVLETLEYLFKTGCGNEATEDSEILAKFLYEGEGLDKNQVGEFLG